MGICIRKIVIKRSNKEDDYFMPLAEISFCANTISFTYIDYINPFTNRISDVFVRKTHTRQGDQKKQLFNEIQKAFYVDISTAIQIYFSIIPELNNHITTPQVQAQFPNYNELMGLAYKNGFVDENKIGFNFRGFRNGVERHIRANTVEFAKQQFLEYESDASVLEVYSMASVQKICDEYTGLRVSPNLTGIKFEKSWVLLEETEHGNEKIYYFETLRDVVSALPLEHQYRYHEEPSNY
ncbi:hypothetical protein QZJ86_04160 [Methylomonas montana]|uniref:hypothetical protein n=1 Tax=Methylomonas montana TaxID=3058963 RepID=UPI0026585B8A|nr:hypothetical protein [Methylomonas montana]WKJ91330.1 hypothetical protein QZJ86_04160 [Methylomonas montana]